MDPNPALTDWSEMDFIGSGPVFDADTRSAYPNTNWRFHFGSNTTDISLNVTIPAKRHGINPKIIAWHVRIRRRGVRPDGRGPAHHRSQYRRALAAEAPRDA